MIYNDLKGGNFMISAILSHVISSLILFMFSLILLIPFQIFIKYKALKENFQISKLHIFYVSIFVYLLILMFGFTGIPSIQELIKYSVTASNGFSIEYNQINSIPFKWINYGTLTYIENIILFVPLGFLSPFIWDKYESIWKTTFFGFSISLLIEFSQLFNWRVSDIDDLMMNTLGILLGYYIFIIFRKIFSCFSIENHEINNKNMSLILKDEAVLCIIIAFCTRIFFNFILL